MAVGAFDNWNRYLFQLSNAKILTNKKKGIGIMMEKPLIHLFETRGRYYFYDVPKNSIVEIDKVSYEYISSIDNNDIGIAGLCEKSSHIKNLVYNGFLSPNKTKEIFHYDEDRLEYYLQNKVGTIILEVTQQCNLRCEYCVFSGKYENRKHSNKKMSIGTAKKGIDFVFDRSKESEQIVVGFYGGEPLLEFGFVKGIVEYSEQLFDGKELLFSFTTNGTLLDLEKVEYLKSHNVSILISLDGPAEINDKNRHFAKGSSSPFLKVKQNLENIISHYPEFANKLAISAVVDPSSDFACTNDFFVNSELTENALYIKGGFISPLNKKDPVTTTEDFIEKYNYEIFKLYLSKLNKLDKKYISRLMLDHYQERKVFYDKLNNKNVSGERVHVGGGCVPGIQKLFMDVTGNLYPCEKVNAESDALNIGNIETGFNIDKVRQVLNVGKLTESLCKDCWSMKLCPLCALFADDGKELSSTKKVENCKNVKKANEDRLKDVCTLIELGVDFQIV